MTCPELGWDCAKAYRNGCRCEVCHQWCSDYYHSRKGVPIRKPLTTLAEKILAKVEWQGGCAIWTGAKGPYGHGSLMVNGKRVPAHRLVYELERGAVDKSLQMDHMCLNGSCVNPEHLQPVTPAENMQNRRGSRRDNISSGIRGVSWDKSRSKWLVSVQKDRKSHNGGRFDSLEDAERAAIALRNQLFTNNLVDRGLNIE